MNMRDIKLLSGILLFLLMLTATTAKAQLAPKTGSTLTAPNANYKETQMKIYSMFILNFIKYIEWPDASSNFTVAVLDDPDITKQLEEMARVKSRDNLNIEVRQYSSAGEIIPSNIVFVPSNNPNVINAVITRFQGKPVLVVTNIPEGTDVASGINFVTVDGRPRFQINDPVVERLGLKVSGQLKSFSLR